MKVIERKSDLFIGEVFWIVGATSWFIKWVSFEVLVSE